jgi:hypothetical protein
LVDVAEGLEVGIAIHEYQDGVIDEYLPGSAIRLERDWAWASTRWRPTVAKLRQFRKSLTGSDGLKV